VLSKSNLLADLARNTSQHARGSAYFSEFEASLLAELPSIHSSTSSEKMHLGELGLLLFPYFEMGEISSTNLFGLDELILFSFYFANRARYKKMLDLGANIGLHTLVMKKLGFEVVSYEPDTIHLSQIIKVLELNGFSYDGVRPKAISDHSGTMEYLRVLGNTTGSHLLGSKDGVYGPTDVVAVEVDDILEVLRGGKFDFVKMDVEGHEVVLLNRISAESILKTDIMLEVGSQKNAAEIFQILSQKKIPAYSQKTNWSLVKELEDLPSHHTHGSLFLSMQGAPNWD
jgi:FkbM family methyltransferase